jgi:hypothetical protein
MRGCRTVSALFLVTVVSVFSPFASGDSVISSEEIEILEAGNFENSADWSFSSTRGFTWDQADYTVGMIADGEMSFTHSRPDNFDEHTSWASSGCDDCNATFGSPDGFYSWSKGPDITMGGYSFTGLQSMEIENVSLVLHISIPDELPSDEVNVILQNQGSDILVTTFARTLSAINRMNNPIVLELDSFVEWDWSKLEQTQFNIDYVSDNQGADDSEVRVDAVGIRVKFHQPWFSFENVRADHSIILDEVPVIDVGTFEGSISGLSHSTCGLTPEGTEGGIWNFHVTTPPNQDLGRIHVFGEGNHSIWTSPEESGGEFTEVQSGDLLEGSDSRQYFRVAVEDGCIFGARVDVNDPRLIVSGRVSGGFSGLSEESSSILFAIGNYLVHSEEMVAGQFTVSVPVGHALPEVGGEMRFGVATRFQWSSNGVAESTTVHIGSISISGGFSLEWDRDPFCEEIGDLVLAEDGGGVIIPLSPICSDDITSPTDLVVSATTSDENLLKVTGDGSLLTIEPEEEENGVAQVYVTVGDGAGNSWEGSFSVEVEEFLDPPEIVYIPSTLYIELGEQYELVLDLFDPDTELLAISTTKSWATINENGAILLEPVEIGEHLLSVSVSDGTSEVSRNIMIFVTAKPDLLVESIEIRVGGAEAQNLANGDVVELIGFIRNQGRGSANDVTFYCRLDGILVGTGTISQLEPGDLKMAVCDLQLIGASEIATFLVEIDGTNSIDETVESNNFLEVTYPVENSDSAKEDRSRGTVVIMASLLLVVVSVAAFQLGPKSPKKDFEQRK